MLECVDILTSRNEWDALFLEDLGWLLEVGQICLFARAALCAPEEPVSILRETSRVLHGICPALRVL